jgi:cobalt-precorrin 5A hydrolase
MKRLSVGIGCRRGASIEQIDAAVRVALGDYAIDDIRSVATLDAKAEEPGLVAFCAQHGLPLRVFSRAQIASLPALATPSAAVQAHMGVGGVCEPCALLAAPAGKLIIPKRVLDGVAVAVVAVAVADTTFVHDPSKTNHQDHR